MRCACPIESNQTAMMNADIGISLYNKGQFRCALKFFSKSLEITIPEQTTNDHEIQMRKLAGKACSSDVCNSQGCEITTHTSSSFKYKEIELEIGMQCFDVDAVQIDQNNNGAFPVNSFISKRINSLLPWIPSQKINYDNVFRCKILVNMGLAYLQLCDEPSASEFFRLAFEVASHRIKFDFLPILCLYHMARLAYITNSYEESYHLYSDALSACRHFMRRGTKAHARSKENIKYLHRFEASCLVGISWLCIKNEDMDNALYCCDHAMSLQLKVLKEEHFETGATNYILGVIHHVSGDYSTAMTHYLRYLDIAESSFGDNHPHTASALHQIGNILLNEEELDEAMDYFLRALQIRKEIFGPCSIHAARTLYSIGCVYFKQENFVDALDAHNNSLHVKLTVLGGYHIETMETALQIGQSHHKRGELHDALLSYRLVLKIALTSLEKNDPFVARIWKMIGIAQLEFKGTSRAMNAFSEAIKIDEEFGAVNIADNPDFTSASLLHLAGDQVPDAAAA